jgi:hypothetical protein
MSNPKRQHYLPDFFLRGFGVDGRLAVFDRIKNECRMQSAKNVAVIGHYYTFEGENGTKDYEIEKMLGIFERKAKPVIDKLDHGAEISTGERTDLGYFLALLITRVPRHERTGEEIINIALKHLTKDWFPSMEAIRQRFEGTEQAMNDEQAAYFYQFVHEERYTIKRSRNNTIVDAIERARQAAPHMIFMDWLVVHTTDEFPFVLSDAPLGFIVDEKDQGSGEPILGLLSDRVTKVIPLTQKTCLLLLGDRMKARLAHFSVDAKQVDELNKAVIHESERIIVGRDERTVSEAIRKASPIPPGGSKMRLDEIPHPTDPLRSLLVMHRTQPGYEKTPLKIDSDRIWREIDSSKK